MKELIQKIEQWATDRNIIKGSKPIDQAMKLFSEFGELADNVGKGRDCRDDIGDVFVVLTIMAKQNGETLKNHIDKTFYSSYKCEKTAVSFLAKILFVIENNYNETAIISALDNLRFIANHFGHTLEECVQIAYNDIKDRKGIMSNGVFIKESDPAYASIIASIESNCE